MTQRRPTGGRAKLPAHADLLIKLLERLQALAEQLAGLADKQAALIDAGDSDALLAVLTNRQRIMDQFTAGQDSLTRLSDAARRDEPAGQATQERIGALIEDISDRLTDIMRLDEKDRSLLEASRDGVGEALPARRGRRTSAHAPSRPVSPTARDNHEPGHTAHDATSDCGPDAGDRRPQAAHAHRQRDDGKTAAHA